MMAEAGNSPRKMVRKSILQVLGSVWRSGKMIAFRLYETEGGRLMCLVGREFC